MDDTCIHSESFDQHLTDLEQTFKALESANIQLRKDKCSFGYPYGEFLGHIVSHEGHSPIPRLLNKISNAQIPSSKKQLQRFLGLANFYREYIPKFATVAEPLYALTGDRKEWSWGAREEEAFQSLKTMLTKSPTTLAFPD